jgi:hypothetical protein
MNAYGDIIKNAQQDEIGDETGRFFLTKSVSVNGLRCGARTVRAALRIVWTLAFELSLHANKRRDESRRGTHECARHNTSPYFRSWVLN